MKRIITLLFFLIPVIVSAQTDTNSFFNKLRRNYYVSGVNFGFGYYTPRINSTYNYSSLLTLLKETVTEGREKIDADEALVYSFPLPRHGIYVYKHHVRYISCGVSFKRKAKNKNGFFNYLQTAANISLVQHNGQLLFWGDSVSNKQPYPYTEFQTTYYMEMLILRANISATIETPALFNFIALYTGGGVYLGKPVDFYASTQYTQIETGTVNNANTGFKYLNTINTNFESPKLNAGAWIPLGVKLNLSKHHSLKFEYIFDSNNYLGNKNWANFKQTGFGFYLQIKPF